MKKFTVALAGNPNTGKSSVFNALTGSHQHVGNWPGKTIEKATRLLLGSEGQKEASLCRAGCGVAIQPRR